ncbi:MAG TPA: extracellular solute-binding protein [Burkholderiaceae bacterium]|nr:extracellular solute-binding protein [Burkholderiaceae bacterium]
MNIQVNGCRGQARRLLAGVSFVSFASLAGMSCAHAATTDVNVWYAMNAHNSEAFQSLAKEFNRSQDSVKVVLKAFDSPEAVESALQASQGKKGASPNLAQMDDIHSADDMRTRRYILPLHDLLSKHPIKDAKWFLSSSDAFAHDTRGRLTGFPYMASVPVMFYDIDAFHKAKLSPAVPQGTWLGLQAQLVSLANGGSRKCPFAMAVPVSVDLENLAAVNQQFYASGDNGFKAKGMPKFNFDLMYVRHLSLMKSWVSVGIMTRPEAAPQAVSNFASRECAVLMADSANIGTFNDARSLKYGVSGLPHYPEATKTPGHPFVGGSALWAIKGHPAAQDKATAQFLAWLAKPANAAKWYQETGYLPLTTQAFDATGAGYYKNLGDWRAIVADYATRPDATERGFWVNNYPQIRVMLKQTLDRALNGQEAAVPALQTATSQADRMVRER